MVIQLMVYDGLGIGVWKCYVRVFLVSPALSNLWTFAISIIHLRTYLSLMTYQDIQGLLSVTHINTISPN